MMKTLPFIRTLLFVFSIYNIHAQTHEITLNRVNYAEVTKLNRDTYGVNNQLFSSTYYLNHPGFIKIYTELGMPTMRYPGGTVGNYINLATGKADAWTNAPEKNINRALSLNKSILNSGKRFGEIELSNYIDFLIKTDASSTFMMNITSMSEFEIETVLKKINNSGADLKYIEIGNELYFNTYKTAIKDVKTYIAVAKNRALLAKKYFPSAKIGIILPSHIYTHESFLDEIQIRAMRQKDWYNALKTESFYDALIIHMYSTVGMDRFVKKDEFYSFQKGYQFALSHVDGQLALTLNKIEKDFPNIKIWVTEYHVGGFTGDVRRYRLRHTYLGGLFNANFMLKLFSNPSVELSNWHSMVQMLVYKKIKGQLLDSEYIFGTKVNYDFLKLFKNPVTNSTHFAQVSFNSIRNYQGLGKYSDAFKDIEGGIFTNKTNGKSYLMIINKWENSYSLFKSDIENKIQGSITNCIEIAPNKNLDKIESLASEESLSNSFINPKEGLYKLVPFSIQLYEFERAK